MGAVSPGYDVALVEAAVLADDDLARVRQIFTDAFPEDLQVPFDDLFRDRMLVLVDDGGAAGFALVRNLADGADDTGWTFLRYYAVGRKGAGLGSLMWRALTARLGAEGRTRLVWDVEDPDEPGLSEAHVVEHRRRIVFYERLGGRLLPVRGYQPPHDDGHAPHLRLMDQPLAPDVTEPPLRDLVEGVYRLRYGLEGSHPAVVRTIEASGLA